MNFMGHRHLYPLLTIIVVLTFIRPLSAGDYRPMQQVVSSTGFYIIVDKTHYALFVYGPKGLIASYPAVFGSNYKGDKFMEGDNRTPEGVFHIVSKKIHKQWGPFLLLDYPNEESWKRFNERKAAGIIPANATIGGGVGIHGTRVNEDFAVERYQNWTWGCVSLKHLDAKKLYDMIPIGTEVLIRQ